MPSLRFLDNSWWENVHRRAAPAMLDGLERLHQKADQLQLGPLRGGALLQVVLLNACLCVPYIVFADYRSKVLYLVQMILHVVLKTGKPVVPHLTDAIYLSRVYPVGHFVFLLSCFVPRTRLLFFLAVCIVLAASIPLFGDPLSVLLLSLFVASVFPIARWRRLSLSWKVVFIFAAYILVLNASQWLVHAPAILRWPSSEQPKLTALLAFSAAVVPMLWYSCYAIAADRLTFRSFNFYLITRFFVAPVFPPKDLYIDWAARRRWQWRGVFTLGSAFAGNVLAWALQDRYLAEHHPDWFRSTGPALLWYCCCFFLAFGFRLQAMFNMFVGMARLFGFPIKDNFFFWFLARTPNEHWRRWNMLFREWILTAVFYPLMRARKGLFVAIMVTLLASGLVHLMGTLTPGRFDLSRAIRSMLYWAANGIAIYFVVVFPRKLPNLMERLRIRESVFWSVFGILLTTVFYSVVIVARNFCTSWAAFSEYLNRLAIL